MNAVCTVARKEIADHVRNGWIVAVASAFAFFALAIALAGVAFTGQLGQAESQTTLVSLTSLSIYLIPLLGLLLGYDGIAGEGERGTLDLLLTCPVSPQQLLLGKWLGLAAVLGAAVVLGLLAPAALAVWHGGAVLTWVAFAAFTLWLGAIFVALALLLSTLAVERGTLVGLALGVWLVLVLLFDLSLIGLLVATGGAVPPAMVEGLFYFNPTSLFRFLILAVLVGGDSLRQLGLAEHLPSLGGLLGALALWSVAPLAAGSWRLARNR